MLVVSKIDSINKCLNIFKNKNDFLHLENISPEKVYNEKVYRNYITSDINVFFQKIEDKIKIFVKLSPNKIISATIEPKEEKELNINRDYDIILSIYTITQEPNTQYKKSKTYSFVTKNTLNAKTENIKDFVEKTYDNLSMLLKINNVDIAFFVITMTYIMISIKKMIENSQSNKQGVIVFDKTYRINLQMI